MNDGIRWPSALHALGWYVRTHERLSSAAAPPPGTVAGGGDAHREAEREALGTMAHTLHRLQASHDDVALACMVATGTPLSRLDALAGRRHGWAADVLWRVVEELHRALAVKGRIDAA